MLCIQALYTVITELSGERMSQKLDLTRSGKSSAPLTCSGDWLKRYNNCTLLCQMCFVADVILMYYILLQFAAVQVAFLWLTVDAK